MSDQDPLLDVRDLSVVYESRDAAPLLAVDHVSFSLAQGEFVGLVGESGSGKSTLGYALTRLLRAPARTSSGEIRFAGEDVRALDPEQLRRQRHGGFAMVLQSGMNALSPVRTVRDHFRDIFRAHGIGERRGWDAHAAELLGRVELDDSALGRYPGQLSGGMRQRVSIALALSLEPRLMVFDEPTTALDVLVQKAVMRTIVDLQRSEGFTAVLISHDLGIVLETVDRVLVMHEGRVVEDGPSGAVLADPQDDYTQMLLSHYADPRAEEITLPGFDGRSRAPRSRPVGREGAARSAVVVDHVSKTYPRPHRGAEPVRAVRDVSFALEPGAALALVGQSGSGKSTLASMIAGVEKPSEGEVRLGDVDLSRLRGRERRALARDVQLVFQDPYAALNPVHSIGYTLSRPVVNHGGARGSEVEQRVHALLDQVGLGPAEEIAAKLPHQLSGGQRQRVVIARALAADPQVLIADEPVSMLDVTMRSGVLALLSELREERGLSLLYITHDLLSARLVTDDILVLHEGAVAERGRTLEVLRSPQDDYTRRLLDSIPNPRGDAA